MRPGQIWASKLCRNALTFYHADDRETFESREIVALFVLHCRLHIL